MKVTVIPIVIGMLDSVIKGLIKGTGGLGNRRMNGDHLNNSIIKIGQNTKSPGDLGRLVQTPVRNHQLMLIKNSQMSKIMIIIED